MAVKAANRSPTVHCTMIRWAPWEFKVENRIVFVLVVGGPRGASSLTFSVKTTRRGGGVKNDVVVREKEGEERQTVSVHIIQNWTSR